MLVEAFRIDCDTGTFKTWTGPPDLVRRVACHSMKCAGVSPYVGRIISSPVYRQQLPASPDAVNNKMRWLSRWGGHGPRAAKNGCYLTATMAASRVLDDIPEADRYAYISHDLYNYMTSYRPFRCVVVSRSLSRLPCILIFDTYLVRLAYLNHPQ